MNGNDCAFLKVAGRILNAGQTRALILTGNVNDLFPLATPGGISYVPLIDFLAVQWDLPNKIVIIYELNGPIRFLQQAHRDKVRDAWLKWRTGLDSNALAVEVMLSSGKARAELETMSKAFEDNLSNAVGKPTVALEILRQICLCSRTELGGRPVLLEDVIVLIEAADMVIPEGDIAHLSEADRHRVCICRDWFSDPGFMNGGDAVALLAESRSLVNGRVSQLPQIIEIPVPSPDESARKQFTEWFDSRQPEGRKLTLWGTPQDLARSSAGFSIHALMQLLKGTSYQDRALSLDDVVVKVEEYIQRQLGEDMVEFKKPTHSLDDVVGFSALKTFLREELIPRFRSTGPEALPGAAVCGPIGGGKTFIFEAVAKELDMVVLVLKNIRSQWFGQTDVLFERLRRTLEALDKVLIFVDEADTQFGGVGPDAHETERRLTGKIQAMMSDPRLRGHVIWLLMTARIHRLSPDIRRPGRVGDLIIPILDPTGKDWDEFLLWTLQPAVKEPLSDEQKEALKRHMGKYSSASFASLRSELKAKAAAQGGPLPFEKILAIVQDLLPPAIDKTRRYQTLQALVNCTRRSLLPDPTVKDKEREKWEEQLRALEAEGVQ